MNYPKIVVISLTALITLFAHAATIHECRAYNGSTFYSNNYCSQSNGVGVLNHSVPDNMSFEQQVRLVEASKAKEAARARENDARWTQSTANDPAESKRTKCQQLDKAIAVKDAELRQPHSAQWGDYLTEERRKLNDRKFSLGC